MEWKQNKKWNPFNSFKLLAHTDRWKGIRRNRPIPAPVLITVDPSNICNLNCVWCNAEFIRNERHSLLSEETLMQIADFLPKWEVGGVSAQCVAGGGEPLVNPATHKYIDRSIDNGIEVGVVTNGILMDKHIDTLARCTWVGISIDAATQKTFLKYKQQGQKNRVSQFDKVIENIQILVDYSRRYNTTLGERHPAYGVSYKYLLYKDNIPEMYAAAKLAKEIGCKSIHFRPASTTWDSLNTPKEIKFSKSEIDEFHSQVEKCYKLDDDDFGVFGVTHKFGNQFERCNNFERCYAIFMTAVFMPTKSGEGYCLGLCCDRRGDGKLELISESTDVNEINRLWGSREHWAIYDNVDVAAECPRCTYSAHNEIFQEVILKDGMTYKFI